MKTLCTLSSAALAFALLAPLGCDDTEDTTVTTPPVDSTVDGTYPPDYTPTQPGTADPMATPTTPTTPGATTPNADMGGSPNVDIVPADGAAPATNPN